MSSNFLIIGGGVIGLSIARELKKRRLGSIAIVDKGRIGAEASWAAAGMLAPNAEGRADDEFFRLCTASSLLFSEFATELLDETGIDIELDRSGTISIAFTDQEAAELRAKYEWQQNAGIEVEFLTAEEISQLEPEISPEVRSGYLYPNDWQVENRKLLEALRKYCKLNGVMLLENAEIMEVIVENGSITGAISESVKLTADHVVITAGAWSSNILPTPVVKPIRGQMISLAGGGPRILRHVIYSPRAYIVPRVDGRILVGATVEDAGFNKEVTPEAIASLKASAVELAPSLADYTVSEAWAGLRPFVRGEMPLIGRIPDLENAFVATGHYRNGILLAPITAKIIADEILASQTRGVSALSGPA